MATLIHTTHNLEKISINKIDSVETYQAMIEQGLIESDELYIIGGNVLMAGLNDGVMSKVNPTGEGSLSINRKENTIIGDYSVAVGQSTESSGTGSFAEGCSTTASDQGAHSEGMITLADGAGAHAEGSSSSAMGEASHAEGDHTYISKDGGHAQGAYNLHDDNHVFLDIIGNGVADNSLSNAYAMDTNGNAYFSGALYQGCTDYSTDLNGLTTAKAGGRAVKIEPNELSSSGAITATLEDNTHYNWTSVTSLTITCPLVQSHGFISFASVPSPITFSSPTGMTCILKGDDITQAAANEIWEFSSWGNGTTAYLIFKNWSAT